MIATIANGLNTLNLTQGVIYITTGGILLFAVTLDTILRRRQRKGRPLSASGRQDSPLLARSRRRRGSGFL